MSTNSFSEKYVYLIALCAMIIVGCSKDKTIEDTIVEEPIYVEPTIIGEWKMIKRNDVHLIPYQNDSIKIFDNGVYKKVGPKKITPTGVTQYTEYIGSWYEINDSIILELNSFENHWAYVGGGDSLYVLPCSEKWMVTSYDIEHLLITNLNVWNNCCAFSVLDSTNLFKRL